jgi:hypothetical protein
MPSDFLEKTLETIIYENYRILQSRGLDLNYRHIDKQFKLPSGKIIDLINWQVDENEISLSIIELKKDICSDAALWQLLEYVHEIIYHLTGHFDKISYTAILIGDSIGYNVETLLLLKFPLLKIYSYQYNFDGITFKKENDSIELQLADRKLIVENDKIEESICKRFKFQEKLRTGKVEIKTV